MALTDKKRLKELNKQLHKFSRNRTFRDIRRMFPIIVFLDPNVDNQAKMANFFDRITGEPTSVYHFANVEGMWAAMFLPTNLVDAPIAQEATKLLGNFTGAFPTADILLQPSDMGL